MPFGPRRSKGGLRSVRKAKSGLRVKKARIGSRRKVSGFGRGRKR